MILPRTALTIFLGLFVLSIAHAVYYYPQLPDIVASHFGSAGKPDAWSSRHVFVGIYLFSVIMTGLIFLGLAYGMRSIPDNLINLPNRDYWLSQDTHLLQLFYHLVI